MRYVYVMSLAIVIGSSLLAIDFERNFGFILMLILYGGIATFFAYRNVINSDSPDSDKQNEPQSMNSSESDTNKR